MKRLFLVLLAALPVAPLLAAFSPSSPLFTRLSGTVTVPAEFSDGALFIETTINGRGPFRLMVDTGSSVALLTPACAAAVNSPVDEGNQPPADSSNAFGQSADVQPVLLRTLEIGGARFEGVTAGVSSDLVSVARATGRRFDGVLGFSLFADVVVAVDFPGRQLILSRTFPENLPPVRAELAVRQVREIPLVLARFQGEDLELAVDTGSSSGVVIPAQVALTARWKAEPRPGPLVNVLGDSGREIVGRLAGEVHFGAVAQIEPVVGITEGSGSVGAGFLRHFCVVFDQAHDQAWLCAASDDPVPAPPTRTVGLSLLADAAGWRVAGTIPGSPAEGAGIRAGDIVTQIEGRPAAGWSRDQIEGWSNQHTQLAVHVTRDHAGRDLALPVWALVP